MNSIPIFDSLTHPTINGDWIMPRYPQASIIDYLIEDMHNNNICKALAVGMKGIGNYSEQAYAAFITNRTDKLIPIAFFDIQNFNNINEIARKLKILKQLGYRGIKLHPRIGRFDLKHQYLTASIKSANDAGLTVLLCTYFYNKKAGSHLNNITQISALLEKIPEEKIILLHGGAVQLLQYAELARAFSNVLLDISLTMCKYEGSSIDADINFLFRFFDRRICIGTDHPEFSHKKLRERFNFFAQNVPTQKLNKIAHENLAAFF